MEARTAMLAELQRFAEERVTPVELAQATQYLAGQTVVQRQSAAALAGEIVEAWLAGQGLEDITDPASHYLAVTADEIRDVATRVLGGGTPVFAEGVIQGTGGGK